MRREIFLDMDDTIVALSQHVIDIYNQETGENFDWRKNEKWMWTDADKVREQYFHNILHRKKIFYDAPILGGEQTKEYINELVKLHDVYIITTPMRNNTECFKEKIKWFKKNGINISEKHIIFSARKGLCASKDRILVDDKTSNLDSWAWNDGIAIALAHGWNKDWQGKKINSIVELDRYI